MLNVFRVVLAIFGVGFAGKWIKQVRADKAGFPIPTPLQAGIGLVTNFFDTLGIGSYAPTTAMYKLFKVVPDEHIPGTMNVGNTPNTLIQFPIFLAVMAGTDQLMLAAWVSCAVLGAWLGAGVVSKLPRRKIQLGMGSALLIAAAALIMGLSPVFGGPQLFPAGGEAMGVRGLPLVVACMASFVFGSLMTVGVGIYAPTMVVVSLLGMNPSTAYPLMSGAAAFLMPVASYRFINARRYDLRAALGLMLGGIPGVALAVFVITSLPLTAMKVIVCVVVTYTAITMLRSAAKEKQQAQVAEPQVPVHS